MSLEQEDPDKPAQAHDSGNGEDSLIEFVERFPINIKHATSVLLK